MSWTLRVVGGCVCCFAGTLVGTDTHGRRDGAGASDMSVTEKVKEADVRKEDRTKGNRAHSKLQLPELLSGARFSYLLSARRGFPRLQNNLSLSCVLFFFSAALITRVNVEVNRAGILKEGDEWTLGPVAPQVLRQAEAFCIESGREALWNVLLDGKRWIFAHFKRPARKGKNTVTVSMVSMHSLPGSASSRRLAVGVPRQLTHPQLTCVHAMLCSSISRQRRSSM